MASVEVIIENLKKHPVCIHGPTLLFSKFCSETNTKRRFFGCAACRDRKDCAFFMWEEEFLRMNDEDRKTIQVWEKKRKTFVHSQKKHIQLFSVLNQLKQNHQSQRCYCHDCSYLFPKDQLPKHPGHKVTEEVPDDLLHNPSKFLRPKDNPRTEAQYLFATSAVETIIENLKKLKLRHILCIGAPRIHEYIQSNLIDEGFSSLLLDIDERYRHFFGPLQFCWYNSFNHYFLDGDDSKHVFQDFLTTDKGEGVCVVTDPPFGGRVEPLADGISKISKQYQNLNGNSKELPVLWIFPYFMEPQIKNTLPDFEMLDFKVNYDNHSLFVDKPNGRKYGSPVRIFTNIDSRKFVFSEDGYKFCPPCQKWVCVENQHCSKCQNCTSKNGTTYKHCDECKRCVKPSWKHCDECNRCCLQDHKCGVTLEFHQNCFHCKQSGHKKRECPNFNKEELKNGKSGQKRKKIEKKIKKVKKRKNL